MLNSNYGMLHNNNEHPLTNQNEAHNNAIVSGADQICFVLLNTKLQNCLDKRMTSSE